MISLFKNKYLGKQVEFHSFGGVATHFQCVDLVNQYIKEVLGATPIIGTDAKDFPTKYNKDEFDWIPNSPEAIIEAGDIPIWNGRVGGGAGHIAVALNRGTLNDFTSLDQNWSKKQIVTEEKHNYSNVTGWLRPKGTNMAKELEACLADRLKFWKERDEARAEVEALNTRAAGLQARATDLGNQVGTLQAEVNNRKEQSGRIGAQLLDTQAQLKLTDEQLQKALIDLKDRSIEKGALAIEVEQLKVKIESLKQAQTEGGVTLTISEVIRLILKQKITIKK